MTLLEELQAQSRQLFYEYLQYLKRLKDPQTDLEDFIHEKELKINNFPLDNRSIIR